LLNNDKKEEEEEEEEGIEWRKIDLKSMYFSRAIKKIRIFHMLNGHIAKIA
jgi:hypothetical protein